MSGVGVGQPTRGLVVETQEHGGVLLLRSAAVELLVEQRQHHSRRGIAARGIIRGIIRNPTRDSLPGIAGYANSSHAHGRARPRPYGQLLGQGVGSDEGVQRSHHQGRRNALAADVGHGQPHGAGAQGYEVIVVAAHRPRRPADAMQFQAVKVGRIVREEQVLHLLGDLQLALNALLLLLLGDQLLQRPGHGVEAALQLGHLVARAHLDAV